MEPRQKYEDCEMWEVVDKDVVQLKYDGIWCLAHVHDGVIDYWSRHGKIKKTEKAHPMLCEGKFIGELMFGSEWAQDPKLKDKFFVFDCIEIQGDDIRHREYRQRFNEANNTFITRVSGSFTVPDTWCLVSNFHFSQSKDIWDKMVVKGGYEGLVYRSSAGTWDETVLRQKATFTVDLKIIGFEEGEGRLAGTLGALLASRIGENGSLIGERISIGGGLSDALRAMLWLEKGVFSSRIISVECKRIFKSGKLRHPNFVCFHPDKNDEDFINQYGQLK